MRQRYKLVPGSRVVEQTLAFALCVAALAQAILMPILLWSAVLSGEGNWISALVLSVLSLLLGAVYALLAFEHYRF